jgi:hypothetical protein
MGVLGADAAIETALIAVIDSTRALGKKSK